jgi:D-galactarolactone isomerase
VVVTPRNYGTATASPCAIRQLGPEHTRGVAVLTPWVTEAELQALHDGGIRGIRFTLYTPQNAVTSFEVVEQLAHRVHALGWHLQLHWTAEQIAAHAALLRRLPTPLVFDHLARLGTAGPRHGAFDIVRGLLDQGRAWVKLSGAYLDSVSGAAGDWSDLDETAGAWVRLAPGRIVWGSDWPHSTEAEKPDDAALRDLLGRWIGDDAALLQRVLVDNPAALYDFSKN